jgi:hypothetical protein
MVYYYVHQSMLLIFCCKSNPVYALDLTSYIHFNVVLPLQLTVPCFQFFHQSESPWFNHPNNIGKEYKLFNHPNNIWWGVQFIKCLVQCYPVSFTSSLLWPEIFHSTLFSNMLGLCSLRIRDQISHPIVFLCFYVLVWKINCLYFLWLVSGKCPVFLWWIYGLPAYKNTSRM